MDAIDPLRSAARDKLGDFLVAEYGHVAEFLIHNEESGEKRAAFFVTLVGVAAGVLGLAFSENPPILARDEMPGAAAAVAVLLLCLGLLTVQRLVERHVATDECIFALRTFRRLFVTQAEAATVANAFFKPYGAPRTRSPKFLSIGRGGWLETVTFLNALLIGTILTAGLATRTSLNGWVLATAAAPAALAWFGQLQWARHAIATKRAELKKADRYA